MKELICSIINTCCEWPPLIARLALGIVMFPHGAQKVLGWFGGQGLERTIEFFSRTFHLPQPLIWLIIAGEFLGSICLILGFFSRVAAAGFIAIMIGAITIVHHANGFFMNWGNQQKGEGYEYHLLALALALIVLIAGGGRASIDSCLSACCRDKSCCNKNFDQKIGQN